MNGDDAVEGPAALLARLRDGEELPEGELVRCLRSPACPRELVERLAVCRWVRTLRHVPPLLLRHPGCPRSFAWEVLPRLGWHDLVEVVRDPRTAPAVRRQGERKLAERLRSLTIGERAALARVATRELIGELLADEEPACVEALLGNPQLTEAQVIRLVATNRRGDCVTAVLHHPRWGTLRPVIGAAVRSRALPVAVALGLLATLSQQQLAELARSPSVRAAVSDAALALYERSQRGAATGAVTDG